MKTDRLNKVIFIVSLIAFLLQIVGYLAPAWFVQEIKVNPDPHGMYADGRRFHLPTFRENAEETMARQDHLNTEEEDEADGKTGFDSSPDKRPISSLPEEIPQGAVRAQEAGAPEDGRPKSDSQNSNSKLDFPPNNHPGSTTNELHELGTTQSGDQIPDSRSDSSKMTGGAGPSQRRRRSESRVEASTTLFCNEGEKCQSKKKPGPVKTSNSENVTDEVPVIPEDTMVVVEPEVTNGNEKIQSVFKDKEMQQNDMTEQRTNMEQYREEGQILYLSAGLWYSRACLTSRDPEVNGDNSKMQWCTMYTRFDGTTLERKRNMFELRLMATLGVVLSALSVLISSTACCSYRHLGKRAVSSLTSLFISGAVMAVPVVHIIVQHTQNHGKFLRRRKWMDLTVFTHLEHDLFDHYSVILCGTASVISVLVAVILTLVSCRSSSKSDNRYNLRQPSEDRGSKHELPINWVHNIKITMPQVVTVKDETKADDSESGYSEVKDDSVLPSNDESCVGNDDDRLEFNSCEIKTFEL